MIVTELTEGLGNQLFQYATGRCIAIRNKTELKFDIGSYEGKQNTHHSHYKLNKFKVKEKFATAKELQGLQEVIETSVDGVPGAFMQEVHDSPDNVFLKGYWHSGKYFEEIREILLKELTLKNPLEKISAEWKKKILASTCPVSVHVRHGDYLTYSSRNQRGLLSSNYYALHVNELKKNFPDIEVFVFSDDIQWCKDNLKFDVPTEFVEGCEHDYEEIFLMSLCKHNIISNSTFAWWGAWLNKNPDKKVFAPYPWQPCGWCGETIFSDGWQKVPANYFSGIPPMLSIIAYIEDSPINYIESSLRSIITQRFVDYEMIFIEASLDGRGKICRKIAGDQRVTVLNTDSPVKKFAALNKGLEVARGDYVLFLNTQEIILPHTAQLLSGICEQLFKERANSRKIYLTYSTLKSYVPNIICSTQRLEEDENGTGKLDGIPDKKFSVKVDAGFEKLNNIAELSLTAQQKLTALGSNGINGLVGTKFFKRTFLNKNNIRFEGGGATRNWLLSSTLLWRRKKLLSFRNFSTVV